MNITDLSLTYISKYWLKYIGEINEYKFHVSISCFSVKYKCSYIDVRIEVLNVYILAAM